LPAIASWSAQKIRHLALVGSITSTSLEPGAADTVVEHKFDYRVNFGCVGGYDASRCLAGPLIVLRHLRSLGYCDGAGACFPSGGSRSCWSWPRGAQYVARLWPVPRVPREASCRGGERRERWRGARVRLGERLPHVFEGASAASYTAGL